MPGIVVMIELPERLRRTLRDLRLPLVSFVMSALWMRAAHAHDGVRSRSAAGPGLVSITFIDEQAGCLLELHSYLMMADLARDLGPYGDVFNDDLKELSDRLDACLEDFAYSYTPRSNRRDNIGPQPPAPRHEVDRVGLKDRL